MSFSNALHADVPPTMSGASGLTGSGTGTGPGCCGLGGSTRATWNLYEGASLKNAPRHDAVCESQVQSEQQLARRLDLYQLLRMLNHRVDSRLDHSRLHCLLWRDLCHLLRWLDGL